jgi:hypothetical protein
MKHEQRAYITYRLERAKGALSEARMLLVADIARRVDQQLSRDAAPPADGPQKSG